MKICVLGVGQKCDKECLSKWIYFYKKSQTNIPAILIYDRNTSPQILNLWEFEKEKLNIDIFYSGNESFLWTSSFLNCIYTDICKMFVFKQIGECIILDYDAFIQTKLDNIIPDCEWGMATFSRYSNYFNPELLKENLIFFDEYDYVPWINHGVQIIKKNFSDDFIFYFKKYISKLQYHAFVESYAQDIVSLVHRKNNGIYLNPEWNWYPDSKVESNSIIIEHYYGKDAKKKIKDLI